MNKKIIRIFLILFLFGFHFPSSAQLDINNYSINKVTQDDGLSQGSNYFTFEDSKGFMWITANDALNRYDGNRVKVYNLNRYFKDCPNLQQGYGFAEDDKSNIYIGSVRGLYIYHRKTGLFSLQKIYKGDGLVIPIAFHKGKIWCFNKQYELCTYDLASKEVSFVQKINLPLLYDVHIYANSDRTNILGRIPMLDKFGLIWFVGIKDIITYDTKTNEQKRVVLSNKNITFCCSRYDAEDHQIAIGTDIGILILDAKTHNEKWIQKIGNTLVGNVEAVVKQGSLLASRSENGLFFLNATNNQFHWVENTYLRFNRFFGFNIDKGNKLWMCDDGLGQVIYNFNQALLPNMPGQDEHFKKLKETGIGEFAAFEDGDVIVQNFALFKPKEQKLFDYKFQTFRVIRFGIDTIRKGVWVMNTTDNYKQINQLFFVTKTNKTLKYTINEQLALGHCQNLQVLSDSNLLISFENGLCLYYPRNNQLYKLKKQSQLGCFYINPLSNNRLAVSYLNKEMWLINLGKDSSVHYDQSILPGVQSFYIKEDSKRQQYWVATNNGIYLLDKNFKILTHFDANNGLAGTYIYGLLLDNDGNVWCSHQRGLSSISRDNHYIVNYDKSDGIQDWDFNNRAFYKSKDGTLYFGGVSGFNYFKPPLKSKEYYQPEVYIDEISVNNQLWKPDTSADLIQSLNLPYSMNNISFNAYVRDLDCRGILKMSYRIRELDAEWKVSNSNNSIVFNNLAPGVYTLDFGYFDKYKNQTILQKTITIKISKPFYFSPIFIVLISILFSTIFFLLLLKVRLNKQKRLLKQQQALEQQRFKITADLHDDIGASLSSLQVNSAVAHQLLDHYPDRAQKVLEKIANQSKNLSERIGDMIWSMKPGKDEFITLSSRIKNFANEIMGESNINYRIEIDKEADTQIIDITQRKNIVLITKEAINNAVKYSQGTELLVSIKVVDDKIFLSIKDDGIGFDASNNKGNGLSNMQKRAQEIGAQFEVVSMPQKGTEIKLEMKL